MTSRSTRLELNDEEVGAQVIDGEAIVINLSSGVYYNMDQPSSFAWGLIAGGSPLGDVADNLARRFGLPPEQAESDVLSFASELIRENLMREAVSGSKSEFSGHAPSLDAATDYRGLQLNAYRDMADLLALDPPMPSLQDIPWKPSAS